MHKPINRKLALEMAMQDVMDNMEELSLSSGFAAGVECFEILSIESTEVPDRFTGKRPAMCRDIFDQRAEIVRLRVA